MPDHTPPPRSHAYTPDARNQSVLIGVNDQVVPRDQAVVSVFDSGFMLGDGVWEGLRLKGGVLIFLKQHLDRLWQGAKALDMALDFTKRQLADRIYRLVDANGMTDDVHIRLMVTRGVKSTPYQHPRVTVTGPTVVIIPEWKIPSPETASNGLTLHTVHIRRGAPDVQDPMWNSHSKLNCIAACIQADKAGADEALMLDPHGFVATCNSTHFFVVRGGAVWTSTPKYRLHGITQDMVIAAARDAGIPVEERDFSLTQAYDADEAFCTGTFAGLVPVRVLDGRTVGDGAVPGPMVTRLRALYAQRVAACVAQGRYAGLAP